MNLKLLSWNVRGLNGIDERFRFVICYGPRGLILCACWRPNLNELLEELFVVYGVVPM